MKRGGMKNKIKMAMLCGLALTILYAGWGAKNVTIAIGHRLMASVTKELTPAIVVIVRAKSTF
jgi:hypothetical protein